MQRARPRDAGAPAGLHRHARPPGRGRLRAPAHRVRRPAPPAGRDGGAQGQGPRSRALEPLPPRRALGCGALERRLRAARRDHGPQPHRPRGLQLQRAGHGQHGGPHRVRHPGAAGALAAPTARRRDPLGLRHDRAGRRELGRHEHPAAHRARRRRVRPQRPQVVDHRGAAPAQPDPHRDGQDGAGGTAPPPAEHGARAHGHARRHRRARPARVRLPGPGRPRRDPLRGRPGAGVQPHRRRGRRLPHQPGPPRPWPHPPLHAHDRRRGARLGAAVLPRAPSA